MEYWMQQISFNPLRNDILEKRLSWKTIFLFNELSLFLSQVSWMFCNYLFINWYYLFIYLLFFCLARSRKERFTFGTTSTLWVWLKKTPTLSYQSCFPVYIGYPRITGTSKYRFLAFRSLFPRLGKGQGFLLLLSDILYLAGMGWEKMAINLVREPSKGLTGGVGGAVPILRLCYLFLRARLVIAPAP